MSKKVILIIVTALVVVVGGGGVTAYVMLTKSDKAEYFKAEASTFEYMKDRMGEQFEPELDWSEKTKENPIDMSADLSAEYQDPNNMAGGNDMFDIEDIVNNASLTFNSQLDLDEHQMNTGLEADIAGFELDDFNMYLDDDALAINLPFMDESLQINNEDLSDLIQMDPEAEDVDIDFSSLFESAEGVPDEDIDHLKEEYLVSVYDDLSKDQFDSEKENVDVDGDEVKAKKITIDLSEEDVKEIIVSVLEKAQDDEELQEIVKERLQAQMMGLSAEEADVDLETDVEALFNEDLDEAIDFVEDDMHMPDGLTSTIWVNDDVIVKRDLNVSVGNGDESSELAVEGTNVLDDEAQAFDYEWTLVDPMDKEHTADVTADLSMKDDDINDTIEVSAADVTVAYDGESTLDDDERDFERTLSVTSQQQGIDGSLVWSGNASYAEDQMSSENEFTVETDMLGDIEASLFADMDYEVTKGVEEPDEDSVKDLGDMSPDELQQYFQQDIMSQAQEWFMTQTGGDFGGQQDDGFGEQDSGFGDDDSDDDDSETADDFEDADEKTTTFKLEQPGNDITVDVEHKKDMVTDYEQKTTINYEDVGMEKDEVKEEMEEQNEGMDDLDAVEIDSDYGDDELEQTMTVNVEEGDLEVVKQILGDMESSEDADFVSFDAVSEFLEDQGFEEE